jgi:hypothetical protein
MARKKASAATLSGSPDASTSTDTLTPALNVDTGLAQSVGEVKVEEVDVIKVNNASLADLKNACDDAVKRVSLRFALVCAACDADFAPSFRTSLRLLYCTTRTIRPDSSFMKSTEHSSHQILHSVPFPT